VEFAALSDIIPMRDGENVLPYRTSPNPLPPNQELVALASSVTPGYLNVMGYFRCLQAASLMSMIERAVNRW